MHQASKPVVKYAPAATHVNEARQGHGSSCSAWTGFLAVMCMAGFVVRV
jgi:hypothetical protein